MCRPESVFTKYDEKSELPPLAFSFATKGLRVLLRERGLLKPDGSMDHDAMEAALAGHYGKSMMPSAWITMGDG